MVELMQEINYGRIEGLQIQDGEPVFDPGPTVLRLFLFGKDNGPNESRGRHDFTLKNKIAEMFAIFDRERSLLIKELMIDNGLPVRMTATDTNRA